jgi:hypothetical protein
MPLGLLAVCIRSVEVGKLRSHSGVSEGDDQGASSWVSHLSLGRLISGSKWMAMGPIERVTGRCSIPHLNNTFSLWNPLMSSPDSVRLSSSEPTALHVDANPDGAQVMIDVTNASSR